MAEFGEVMGLEHHVPDYGVTSYLAKVVDGKIFVAV
jgi:hypothetical protein